MNKYSMNFCRLLLFYTIFLSTLPGKEYYLYVTSESQDEVHLIMFDGKKGKVIKDIPVGVWPLEIEGPHGITVSPDGKYWYLSLAHGFPYGHVYKYETGTDKLIDRVELGLFPATMQISNATGLLYVVNFNLHGEHKPSTISIVDTEEMIEVNRIETGVMPHGSRITNDGLKQYSVAMMSGTLYELDVLKFEISRTLFTGINKHKNMNHSMESMNHKNMKSHKMPKEKPTWVYPHPNDRYLYVVNNGTDYVVEIDLNKWAISRKFNTDKGPYNCEVSPNGKYLVITYKSAAKTGIWDLESGIELARMKNTRRITHGVVISSDSRYAFVSVEGIRGEPGSVDIFDLENLVLVDHVEVGKQAGGIAFWKISD
ncbi:MAG: YncE family protein [Candidatus Neomarinimicrobiota bacterium]|nr:YncE family protein [Candidatus Neomarinimicrobiota bacterium]